MLTLPLQRSGRLWVLSGALAASATLVIATAGTAEESQPSCATPASAGAAQPVETTSTGVSVAGQTVTVPGVGGTDQVTTPQDGTGIEKTEYYEDGGYRVTRCRADGSLEIDQVVLPIAVPGGGKDLVPVSVTVPDGKGAFVTTYITYGTPKDPNWSANYRAARDEIRRNTIPPTPERRP